MYLLQQHELSSEKLYLQLHGKRLPPFYHHTMEIIEPWFENWNGEIHKTYHPTRGKMLYNVRCNRGWVSCCFHLSKIRWTENWARVDTSLQQHLDLLGLQHNKYRRDSFPITQNWKEQKRYALMDGWCVLSGNIILIYRILLGYIMTWWSRP